MLLGSLKESTEHNAGTSDALNTCWREERERGTDGSQHEHRGLVHHPQSLSKHEVLLNWTRLVPHLSSQSPYNPPDLLWASQEFQQRPKKVRGSWLQPEPGWLQRPLSSDTSSPQVVICPFSHSLIQHLLSTYYVSGSVLGARETELLPLWSSLSTGMHYDDQYEEATKGSSGSTSQASKEAWPSEVLGRT